MLRVGMSLLNRVKSAVGMNSEAQTYSYQCTVCQTTFESTDPNVGAVACTACGSADVSAVEEA
jgi:rRNA maturation endonuclease Nob1